MDQTRRIPLPLMLLGLTRAVGRVLSMGSPIDCGDALRLGLENPYDSDLLERLRQTFGSGPPPSDLQEELATSDRYIALFEALNWGVSIDDRLTRDWPFEVQFGEYWCDDFAGGELIRGLRYVRNAVHHDWSMALDVDPLEVPLQRRIELLWLAWTSELASGRSDSTGKRAYSKSLAGRPVGDTLLEINCLLEAGVHLSLGQFAGQRAGPAAIKRFDTDRYVPE